ncbi:MAG TPA: type II secretion system F family protein [Terracidiphilus sp.]
MILVFAGVFIAIALPALAIGLGPSRKTRQVLSALDSALVSESTVSQEQFGDFRKESLLSSVPWLNRKLHQIQFVPYLHTILSQANLSWTAGRLLAMCAVGFVVPAYLIYRRWGSVLIGSLVGALLGFAPFGWVLFLRRRRFNRFESQLPEALDLMVSALRAGNSLIAAIGMVARQCPNPIGTEFRACYEEQNYGLELKTAMDNMLTRVPLQDLRVVSTAIMIQKETGGNLAEVLDNAAYAIRQRFRLKRQVMVHTAQGRLTGWVLTVLPVALGFILYLLNPDLMKVLWTRPVGIKMLWTAGGMTVLGGLIIRKIVNMDV